MAEEKKKHGRAPSNLQDQLSNFVFKNRVAGPAGAVTDAQVFENVQKLGNLAQHRRAAKKIAKNKDTIRGLLDSVRQKPRFPKMIEYAVECLTRLAVDEVSVEEFVDEGVLEMMKHVLSVHPYNEEIQRMVNKALQRMCVNPRMTALVAETFGSAPLLFSLNRHVEADTQITTCHALASMMKDKPALDRFVNDGVIEAIAAMLKKNEDNVDILAAAAKALSAIADDPQYADRLLASGVLETLVHALGNNPNAVELAKHAIAIFGKVAKHSPACLKALREMNVVDAIVNALDANPQLKDLLAIGATALASLSDKSDVGSAMNIVKTGDLTESHASALATVGSLALVEENVAYIVETGGIPAIISTLQSASGKFDDLSYKILETGCRALERCAVNEANIYEIMKAGGVKLMMSILQSAKDNEKVVAAALGAIAAMCTRQENTNYIAKVQGAAAAVAAHYQHPNSALVARQVVSVLSALAAHEETVGLVVQQGGIEGLLSIIKHHAADPEIVAAAINALGRLAVSAENIERIKQAGGFQLLVDALNAHASNPELCLQAMLMLETAALIPENIDTLRAIGALDAVMKAMETHPDNPEIQEVGARTLGLFATKEQLVAVLNNFNALVDQLARSNPVTAPGIMARMIPALGMLSNLALIPANLVIFTQNNAVQSLVHAYEVANKQPQSEARDKLVQLITKTIARMCGDEQNASYMLSSGAYSKMLDVVIAQPDNTSLAEITIEVGVAIAAHSALAGQMMALVEKVVTVADVHSLSAKVLAGATKLLGYLATNDASAGQIVQQNGGVVIAESVLNSLPTPEDLLTALAVLSSLAVDEAAVEALIAAGGLDSIIDAMKAHPDKPAILIAAMKALGRLAINEKIAKLIGEKGALALVTQAMRDHHVHEELIEVAVVLLDSLALVPYNAKILLDDCNADELLRWAMASYPDNATIQEAAARCLAVLAAAAAAVPAAFASLDAEALIALLLDPSLTPEQALAALKRVQELLDAEDPTAAQLFLAKGGLQALGALATRFVDNDAVMKACAAAFQTISRRADKLLTKEQLSSMEAPAALEALLKILHPRAGVLSSLDSDQLLAAVSLLGDLASRKENVAAIIKQGGVSELLKMLNSDDPRVLEAAARVLAKISNDEEGALLLAQTATIKELIAAMRKHKDKPDFLRHAVYLLGNLALNELLKTQIGSFGGIQVIIEVMEAHPFVAPLIENCNYTLANLSFNNEMNMGLIVACNGIFHIIQSMINHSTAEDLLDSAMCCLSNLCYKSDANKEMIVKSGGAKAIVDSLLANFNNGNLVISGFRALGNLAFYAPNVSPIIREGGVQSIVAGITVHARNQAVVQIAVGVMTNLAADLSPENMAIMTQEGAVQAIVEVVSNYRDNVEVEIGALTCLINLSRDTMNAGMVTKQGGVIAIVQVMRTLSFDAIVMTKAVALIGMLSLSPVNVPRIIQDQGAAALVEALSSEYDAGALEMAAEALRALFSMGCTEEYCTMLGRQGVIQAVMKTTAKHANNPAMLIECLRTLGGLSRSESNATAMALPSMKCIETSLSTHSREHNLILFAMSFLANLCVYASAAEMVTSTGLVNKVIASLRVYLDNVEVALRCLRALENMALASNNVKLHMKEVDAVPSLKMAHDSALNAEVKKAIQMVIDTIERAKMPAKEEKGGLKSAKAIFGDEEDKKQEFDEDSVVLPEDVRNFLTAGALLMKHSKTAKPKPRHVFITSDLKTLVWKDVRDSKDEKAPPSMKAIKIRTVERGRCTPQLQRKQWGKFLAKEECSFAVIGRERTVDLEAPNATEREKWARMLLTWLDYHKARKRAAARF